MKRLATTLGLTIAMALPAWMGGVPGALAGVAAPQALVVEEVALPPLGVPHYWSSGTYLRVSSPNISLRVVNRVFRSSALADEKDYAALALREERSLGRTLPVELGRYAVTPEKGLVSASSVVVSALIPGEEAYPAGVVDEVWQSQTVETASGRAVVDLQQLFSNPKRALSVVAEHVYLDVVTGKSGTDLCVQEAEGHEATGGPPPGAFAPTAADYRYFALTPAGVAIGIPQGAVASDACGRVEVTIPYLILHPYFNSLGRSLVAGVRPPVTFGRPAGGRLAERRIASGLGFPGRRPLGASAGPSGTLR